MPWWFALLFFRVYVKKRSATFKKKFGSCWWRMWYAFYHSSIGADSMHIIYVIIYCCCWGRGFKAEHAENGEVHCLIDDAYTVVQGPKQGSGSRHPVRSYYHELRQPTCCGQDRHCRAALRLRLPWGARHQHRHQHTRGSCSGGILVSVKGLLCIDEVRCWRSVCCYSLPTPQKNSVLGSIAVGTAIVKFCCEWQETRDGMGANLGRGNISVILLMSFFNIIKDWLFCSALEKLTCSGLHHWNLKVVKAVRRWQ